MDENGKPIVPATPAPDAAAIEKQATERAEAIANEKIQQMKDDLASSLSGKAKPDAPKSWGELQERIETSAVDKAVKATEERMTKKFEDERKQQEDKQNLTLKQTEDAQKAEWARMSQEWSEAVTDGIIPDIAPEVKKKLKANVQFSDLTEEEQNDPGLKAYNEGRLLHAKLKSEGKSTTFYRTLQKFYNKQPAGANAPVMGGSTPTPGQGEEYSYEDVKKNRLARFKF